LEFKSLVHFEVTNDSKMLSWMAFGEGIV